MRGKTHTYLSSLRVEGEIRGLKIKYFLTHAYIYSPSAYCANSKVGLGEKLNTRGWIELPIVSMNSNLQSMRLRWPSSVPTLMKNCLFRSELFPRETPGTLLWVTSKSIMPWRSPVINKNVRQLEPDGYTDLVLDESQSSFDVELWDGEKVGCTKLQDEKRTPYVSVVLYLQKWHTRCGGGRISYYSIQMQVSSDFLANEKKYSTT